MLAAMSELAGGNPAADGTAAAELASDLSESLSLDLRKQVPPFSSPTPLVLVVQPSAREPAVPDQVGVGICDR